MSDFTGGLGEPRVRSPSPGRGGRFDDGGRRSPPPPAALDRWSGNPLDRGMSAGSGPSHRGRSPDFGRKRRRDESPPSRDRYIPNYEREPPRERERREHPYPNPSHERIPHLARHGPNHEVFEDPYRRGEGPHREKPFPYSPERGPPGRGGHKHSRSHLIPPSEMPHLVNFRYFADYMRATSPHIAEDKERLAEQWKRYRQDHSRKQLVAFFEENKDKPWFREKYLPGPEFEQMRDHLKKKGREGKVEKFVQALNSGKFDIINYEYLAVSKKFTPGKSAEANDSKAVDGLKPEEIVNSSGASAKGNDAKILPENSTKENETADGSAVQATVTQPNGGPKAEDPSNNVDAEGEEYDDPDDDIGSGLVDPNASMAAPSDLGSLIGESMKGKSGSDEVVILPPSENQLFIKSISPDLSREELEKHCKQVDGFDYLALSDPHTGKKLHRVGWVTFLPGTDMKAAESKLSESKINNFTLHMMRAERPAFQKLRVCPGIMNTPERIRKDLAQIRQLAAVFEDDYFGGPSAGEEKRGSTAIERKIQAMKGDVKGTAPDSGLEGANPSTPENGDVSDAKPITDQELPPAIEKKALDLYLYYLRTAFNSCYYCVCVCDFQEELLRRCAKHVRKPVPTNVEDTKAALTPQGGRRAGVLNPATQKASEASWARMLDERLTLLLSKDLDPKNFGGENVDEEIHRLCQSQITDEGAGKFRCKNCSKLFKAMNFIEKHIMTKHGEVLNQEPIERIKYLNSYVLDPSHTTPPAPTAPEYPHSRSGGGASNSPHTSHGMMPSMGPPMGNHNDFYHGSYPGMMGNSMGGPGGVVMGGPYSGYPHSMYPAYPGHPYPAMAGPPMFPNGSMVGAHHGGGGPPGPYGHYYMNPMGSTSYPPPYPTPHQVYPALPAIPPMPQGRMPNGNSRRLGDRISRNFADDNFFPNSPHENKRNKRDVSNDRASAGSNGAAPMAAISADPRSKTVLAYNDLDTPAGDEIVLNY